jgi:anti-sigma regulatory factor (Ser/Thr protein kinase)
MLINLHGGNEAEQEAAVDALQHAFEGAPDVRVTLRRSEYQKAWLLESVLPAGSQLASAVADALEAAGIVVSQPGH